MLRIQIWSALAFSLPGILDGVDGVTGAPSPTRNLSRTIRATSSRILPARAGKACAVNFSCCVPTRE